MRLRFLGFASTAALLVGSAAWPQLASAQAAPAAQAAAMPQPPPTVSYLVAAHPLAPGTPLPAPTGIFPRHVEPAAI